METQEEDKQKFAEDYLRHLVDFTIILYNKIERNLDRALFESARDAMIKECANDIINLGENVKKEDPNGKMV